MTISAWSIRLVVLASALTTSIAAYAGDLPNAIYTSGAADPAVTQDNLHTTVCVPGYTKTVRPPVAYTNRLKRQQLDTNYQGRGDMQSVQEDHLIPLVIGGSPSDVRNLWPQRREGDRGAGFKDRCEVAAGKALCRGRISLSEAQQGFSANWIEWCEALLTHLKASQ